MYRCIEGILTGLSTHPSKLHISSKVLSYAKSMMDALLKQETEYLKAVSVVGTVSSLRRWVVNLFLQIDVIP